MAKLTTKKRNALPKIDFAIPARNGQRAKYPIPDKSHARNALSRVAANGTPAEKRAVRRAVARKFPGIKQGK